MWQKNKIWKKNFDYLESHHFSVYRFSFIVRENKKEKGDVANRRNEDAEP